MTILDDDVNNIADSELNNKSNFKIYLARCLDEIGRPLDLRMLKMSGCVKIFGDNKSMLFRIDGDGL